MKDLQKQLTAERKKNELLQQRLTELLPGDRSGQLWCFVFAWLIEEFGFAFRVVALDELFFAPKTDGSRQGGDTSLVDRFIFENTSSIWVIF